MTASPEQLLAALRWRYATKKFDPSREIPAATWSALEEALVLTPSSFGLQPWKFLVIRDPEIRSLLAAESWGQPQVVEASHYVVLTARTDLDGQAIADWIDLVVETQGSSQEALAPMKAVIEGFVAPMPREARQIWNTRQVYIALGQLMTSAALLGIDTCPMEGISTAGYDRLLGLEGTGHATAVACALGYRLDSDRYATLPKVRFPPGRIVEHR